MTPLPKKVLLIEDEERMAELLERALSKIGVSVLRAKDGDEGLAVALSDHPDLILLDIVLPGMDGLTLLHNLRKHEHSLDVPVILLTNLSPDDRIIKEVVHDQPSFYLIKANTSMEDIVSKVKTALGI
jgi:DNA-binding response OmpR family regulator